MPNIWKNGLKALKGIGNSNTVSVQGNYSENNPYAGLTNTSSPWQNFLGALGFKTSQQSWLENMTMQANEWESSNNIRLENQAYDSAQSQAERMRAAGINPDLNGGVDAGSSAGQTEDPSVPEPAENDENQAQAMLSTFANGIMSCFSAAFGLAQNIGSLRSLSLDNEAKKTSLQNQVRSDARNWARENTPESPWRIYDDENAYNFVVDTYRTTGGPAPEPYYDDDGNYHRIIERDDWYSSVQRSLGNYVKKVPRKYRKIWKQSVEDYFKSAPGTSEAYEAWKRRNNERFDYAVTGESAMGKYSDSALAIVADELGKVAKSVKKNSYERAYAENENAIKSNEYDQSVTALLDAKDEASARNEMNRSTASINSINSDIQGALARITERLSDAADRGNVFAEALLVAIQLMRMNTISINPQFNQRTTNVNNTTNNNTN